MVLEKLKVRRQEQGFTLVELLIVIVVIAILAAITIVAYGNVTSKAHDSGYKSDAGSLSSLIETFNADTGAYPTSSALSSNVLTWTNSDGSAATAKQPSGIKIVSVSAQITSATTYAATTGCTSDTVSSGVATWGECTSGGANYYPVWFQTSGACIYYPQTTGTAAMKYTTAGAPSSSC